LKLEVLSLAVVCPGVIAKVTVVDRISFPDVAVRVIDVEGVTAAFEAVSRKCLDCPGMMVIAIGETVTPEGRPLTVTRMTLLNWPTPAAATLRARLGPPSIRERAVGVAENVKAGAGELGLEPHPNVSVSGIRAKRTKQKFFKVHHRRNGLVIQQWFTCPNTNPDSSTEFRAVLDN